MDGRADRDPDDHRRQGGAHRQHRASPSSRTTTQHVLAEYHKGGAERGRAGDRGRAGGARTEWSRTPWDERAAVFLRAADLLAGAVARHPERRDHARAVEDRLPGRDRRGLRAHRLLALQRRLHAADPARSSRARRRASGTGSSTGRWRASCSPWRRSTSPPSPATCRRAPALMGNTVVLKPASTAVYSALLPDEAARGGRPAAGRDQHGARLRRRDRRRRAAHPDLAGIHFTGSTAVFQAMWKTVGDNIAGYHSYPRIVGETGGKDFIVAHPSADPQAVATAIVRGALRVPGPEVLGRLARVRARRNLWPQIRERLRAEVPTIRDGRRRATSATSWAR